MMTHTIQETKKQMYCTGFATIDIRIVHWIRSLEELAPVSQKSLLKPPCPFITFPISINTFL